MPTLKVKNWNKFQHFKERRPPWIKIYSDLLDDYTYNTLPLESQAIAPMLWLLASQSEISGCIQGDINLISYRLRREKSFLVSAINPLIINNYFEASEGFIKSLKSADNSGIDINVISKRYQHDTPETETETETEKENSKSEFSFRVKSEKPKPKNENFEMFWEKYPTNGRGKGTKKIAEKYFSKIKISFDVLIKAVENYEKYLLATGEMNADASTWLNQNRWETDYKIPTPIQKTEPVPDYKKLEEEIYARNR